MPIRLGRGKDLIPTTVHLDSQGNYLFGDDAEDNRATDGAGYVSRFKRDLQTNVPKHIHGRTITPVELTAKFLTHVRERVEEEALHGPVGHAVITVPALYGPAAKANLKEAVKQAGFTDFDLLDEPVAAGFAFLHDNPDFAKGQTFLVFDWGGGTLDIAGVRHNGKELSSISQLIGGDAMLGGEDIDDDIGAGISEQLKQQGRKGIEEQPDEIRFSAWKSITDGKILLSRKVSHRFRFQLSDGPVDFEWKRDTFEELISQTVEKAISMTKRVVEKAHEQSIPLAAILLIGGSSDIPLIHRRLAEVTGMRLLKYDKRQEAVGMGGAILAHAAALPVAIEPEEAVGGNPGRKMPGTRRIPKLKNNEPDLNGLLETEMVQPDALLSVIVGSKPLARGPLTKKLWEYIKKNKLQDAKKRTMINADAALLPIFNGKKQVSMFEMTKLVSEHVKDAGKGQSLTKSRGTKKGGSSSKEDEISSKPGPQPPLQPDEGAQGHAGCLPWVMIFVVIPALSKILSKIIKLYVPPLGLDNDTRLGLAILAASGIAFVFYHKYRRGKK